MVIAMTRHRSPFRQLCFSGASRCEIHGFCPVVLTSHASVFGSASKLTARRAVPHPGRLLRHGYTCASISSASSINAPPRSRASFATAFSQPGGGER